MPLYLVRVAETGREAQPGRSKTRQDIVSEIRARAPDAAIRAAPGDPAGLAELATTGRLLVGAERDLDDVLRAIHHRSLRPWVAWCREHVRLGSYFWSL